MLLRQTGYERGHGNSGGGLNSFEEKTKRPDESDWLGLMRRNKDLLSAKAVFILETTLKKGNTQLTFDEQSVIDAARNKLWIRLFKTPYHERKKFEPKTEERTNLPGERTENLEYTNARLLSACMVYASDNKSKFDGPINKEKIRNSLENLPSHVREKLVFYFKFKRANEILGKVTDKKRFNERNFKRRYSEQEVESDVEFSRRVIEQDGVMDLSLRGRELYESISNVAAKERASFVEKILQFQFLNKAWLGEGFGAIVPSLFDDVVNGVDVILKHTGESNSAEYAAVGIDAYSGLHSENMKRKLDKIKYKRVTTVVKYFRDGLIDEPLSGVPNIVVSIPPEVSNRLLDLVLNGEQEKINQHVVRKSVLSQMIYQLIRIGRYIGEKKEMSDSEKLSEQFFSLAKVLLKARAFQQRDTVETIGKFSNEGQKLVRQELVNSYPRVKRKDR